MLYIARVVFMVVSKTCVCVELVGESPDEGCLDALDKWENLQMWGCFGQVGESPDVGCLDALDKWKNIQMWDGRMNGHVKVSPDVERVDG